VITRSRPCTLHKSKTDWSYFQELLFIFLNNSISLKTDDDVICAIESFNSIRSRLEHNTDMQKSVAHAKTSFVYSSAIKDSQKKKLRKLWQTNRCPVLKTKLNRVIKTLKNLLETERNQGYLYTDIYAS